MRFFKFLFILVVLGLLGVLAFQYARPYMDLYVAQKPSLNAYSGPENASVTIIEFVDYQCEHCYAINKTFEQALALPQNKDVKVVYRPVSAISPISRDLAGLVMAAGLQGKAGALHSAILAQPEPVIMNEALDIAEKVGLDVDKLVLDAKTPAVQDVLDYNSTVVFRLGFDAVPSFVIGGRTYSPVVAPPTVEEFSSMIEQVR